jgi:hypothetical protein
MPRATRQRNSNETGSGCWEPDAAQKYPSPTRGKRWRELDFNLVSTTATIFYAVFLMFWPLIHGP